MRTVQLPSGEQVPALGLGTWNMGDQPDRENLDAADHPLTPGEIGELDRLYPPRGGPKPLEML